MAIKQLYIHSVISAWLEGEMYKFF